MGDSETIDNNDNDDEWKLISSHVGLEFVVQS